jgi:hypothetical protein
VLRHGGLSAGAMTQIFEFLRTYAVEIGTVAAILSILSVVAMPWKLVAWWQTKAARDGAAHVLAMELLPIVTGIKEEVARVFSVISTEPHYLKLPSWQKKRIVGLDVLEPALHRLAVLDRRTRRSIDGMRSAVCHYHRMRLQTDLCHLTSAGLDGELSQRRSFVGSCLSPCH